MAPKRKAQDAFPKTNGPLSAVAAARLARLSKQSQSDDKEEIIAAPPISATSVAATPYDGHHSDSLPSGIDSDVADFVASIPRSPPATRLSNIRKTSIVVDNDEELQINLKANDHVTILGEYRLEVTKGIVTIYGAAITPSTGIQRIFAPSIHAIPQIIARKENTAIIVKSVKSSFAKLGNLSPLFRNIWAKDSKQDRSFTLLNTASDDELKRSLTVLELDGPSQSVLARLSKRMESDVPIPCIMAIGPKSSGKSTLNRLICNTVLNKTSGRKCLYLDLDPGQPEFGPPGQISLVEVNAPVLGPAFTHPATNKSASYRLLKSHTIAGTSFKDDPDHYVACAKDLLRNVNRQYPLVINSCGWVTGLGSSVLTQLANDFLTTDLIVLEPVEETLVQSLKVSNETFVTHRIPRRSTRPSPRAPAEIRSMQTMAYFHHKNDRSVNEYKWICQSIDQLRPWTVSYANAVDAPFTILSYGQTPNPIFLGEVLNGSIVALVTLDDGAFESYFDSQNGLSVEASPEGLPYVRSRTEGFCQPLDPEYSECVGLALVKGVDTKSKTLHLINPLSDSQMQQVMQKRILLIRGSFDAPEWAYLESLYSSPNNDIGDRPWVSKKEMVGVEGAVWRLRHPPMANQVLN